MIKICDLENRKYEGKECIGFEYSIPYNEDNVLRIYFNKNLDEINEWSLLAVYPKTLILDSSVYNFNFTIPIPFDGVNDLIYVAGVGLTILQQNISEEALLKQNIEQKIKLIVKDIISR